MTYLDIINANVRQFNCDWPRYAFHLTDYENAISILSCGYLYSRNELKNTGIITNDNASKEVIESTSDIVKKYARFYFRPKTPTYYHMEGYHQEGLRFQNENNVNIPVPVLLMFDLNTMLQDENTVFNGIKASGKNFNPQKGELAFRNLQFEKIYSSGPSSQYIRDYQHAEVLYPSRYPINRGIRKILCRNKYEAMTLRNLLGKRDKKAHDVFSSIIDVDCSYFSKTGLQLYPTRNSADKDTLILKFKIDGISEYHSYTEQKRVINSTTLHHYPCLKTVFDVRFDVADYHHTITKYVNLDLPQVFSEGDDIPCGAKRLAINAYFDREENRVLLLSLPLRPEWKKYMIELHSDQAIDDFPEKPSSMAMAYEVNELPF